MAFNAAHFSALVRETLQAIGLYSDAALELLLGTCAVESDFGTHLYQYGGGPDGSGGLGEGVFSVEPATEADIWRHHLSYRPARKNLVKEITGVRKPSPWSLRYQLDYQIIICRLKYRMIPHPLPPSGDLDAQAGYWDRFYNANPEKGTVSDYKQKVIKYGVSCRDL